MLFISPILVLLVAPYQKIHAHQTEVMLVVNPVKVQYFLRNVVQPTFHSGPTDQFVTSTETRGNALTLVKTH